MSCREGGVVTHALAAHTYTASLITMHTHNVIQKDNARLEEEYGTTAARLDNGKV